MIDTKIFDTFEHMGVYVVDKTSLIVYYENAIARKYTGRRRIGEPCYKAHGNDTMCNSCPIRRKDHITLVNRSDYNMVFAVRCEEVMWDGHDAYMISVVKQDDSSTLSEEEKTMGRMSRALQKSVNVYTEINMETMRYRQMNLHDSEGFNVDAEGEYAPAFEYMCSEEICPDDVPEIRRLMAPEALRKISYESDGEQEVSVRYRLKNVVPERIMESRAIFMRDEIPHFVVNTTKDVTNEVQLRKQADELESILSHVSCGVAVYNADENNHISIAYINDGIAGLVECPKEVLKENATTDFMYRIEDSDRKLFLDAFHRIIAGEENTDCTFRIMTYHGNKKWINGNLTATQKENGIIQIYGTFIDVTSDIKAQKEFQEKYEIEKRRRQDDTTVLAYGVFDLQSGKVTEMERREPLLPIVGNVFIEDFCADVSDTILLKEQKEKFEEMFTSKNLLWLHEQGIDEQSIEYQRKLPDGKVIWVKSSFRVIADLSKNSILLFYYCYDININKNIELMTAYMVDEDYDMIGYINLMNDDAIMLYGKNSSIRSVGHTQLQSRGKYSESLEWFVHHAVVPEERHFYHTNAFIEQVKDKLAKQSSYNFTLHVQDANKGVRTKRIRYTRNDADANSCFFSQIDITDTLAEEEDKQKRLQEALDSAKQANEAKSAFLSRMSHDMRTPMNGILGMANLSTDETDIAKLKENMGKIRDSGKYLLSLINDTLDLQRIESGKMKLDPVIVSTTDVVSNIIEMISIAAKEKGVELKYNKGNVDLNWYIRVDVLRLKQIFINLLSNAVKFTPTGGTVELEFKLLVREGMISHNVVYVRDTGVGMSNNFLKNEIFKPFSQESNTVSTNYAGSGLGLSIAKSLVEMMGGRIEVESEPEVGTTFAVYLDFERVSEEEARTALQSEKKQSKNAVEQLKGKKILLVEDHPLNAEIAKKLLQKAGCEVTWKKNGQEAVSCFAEAPLNGFDAVLMDIRMPVMDGLEATRQIRGLDKTDAATVPIIAMTANAYEEDVTASLDAGMNAHLGKPIEPKVLYDTLATYLVPMIH